MTAASLLGSSNAAGIAKATAVTLSGTTNTVTAAQATVLAALSGFALAPGATLVVSDTAANLLANAAGAAKATSCVAERHDQQRHRRAGDDVGFAARLRAGLRRDPAGV